MMAWPPPHSAARNSERPPRSARRASASPRPVTSVAAPLRGGCSTQRIVGVHAPHAEELIDAGRAEVGRAVPERILHPRDLQLAPAAPMISAAIAAPIRGYRART
ncbi:hypothetical protein ASE10_05225 [Lysobacter sp. Root76]|nr:hypothetical protein ASE10_05225 [Lysobacter sp. Root76]KRD64849.1 hypothetical protein ASE45_19675 [Lysobacter sp. Root96]